MNDVELAIVKHSIYELLLEGPVCVCVLVPLFKLMCVCWVGREVYIKFENLSARNGFEHSGVQACLKFSDSL